MNTSGVSSSGGVSSPTASGMPPQAAMPQQPLPQQSLPQAATSQHGFNLPAASPGTSLPTPSPLRHGPTVYNPTIYNRIQAVIEHIPWYGFRTQVRLAHDSHVSEAAISRLLRGECQPSLLVALQVTQALEERLGRSLDVRELFSLNGSFATPSTCRLAGCPNCLPELFYDEADNLLPAFRSIKPGQWALIQPHHGPLQARMQPHSTQPESMQPAPPQPALAGRKEGR